MRGHFGDETGMRRPTRQRTVSSAIGRRATIRRRIVRARRDGRVVRNHYCVGSIPSRRTVRNPHSFSLRHAWRYYRTPPLAAL